MVRTLALVSALALAACEPAPETPSALAPVDSAREALRDSLYEAEMARRATRDRQRSAYRKEREERERWDRARWAMLRSEDWSDAPDSVIVRELRRMTEEYLERRWSPYRSGRSGRSPLAQVFPSVPRLPVRDYQSGLPRAADPMARVADSLARAHSVRDRMVIESVADTSIWQTRYRGFDIISYKATTDIRAVGDEPDPALNGDSFPRETTLLLAVRAGAAEVLFRQDQNWHGLTATVGTTPNGPVLWATFLHTGNGPPPSEIAEWRGGRWRHLGASYDLGHLVLPPGTDYHYRAIVQDLEAMEVRTSLYGDDGRWDAGCLVSPILKRGGRFEMGAPVWHRDVESCEERMFEPSVRVDVDTSAIRVDSLLRQLTVDVTVHARPDTTSRYDWRLLSPDGRERWAGTIPAGLPADSTYRFEEERAAPGDWLWIETERRVTPRYDVAHAPPHVSRRIHRGR